VKKIRREHCSKIELVQKKEKRTCQKKDPERGGERVYVLAFMFVTFPTCQVERLPLKAPALLNTAPQQ
jgi:hypothetical protein